MKMIKNYQDFQNAVKEGGEPLLDWRRFVIPIGLRIEIQQRLFGTGNTPDANERFYRYVWAHKPHICEEYMRPLDWYSAVYISHILSRGAHPEMAYDPRNTNILSFEAHQKWENGNRESMRIYEENQIVVDILLKDYAKL